MTHTRFTCWLVLVSAAGLDARSHSPAATPPSPQSLPTSLAAALQQQLDEVVAHFLPSFPDLAMSVAWKDASNDVAIASGKVGNRNISSQDTFLYGSGTKPFTATAVLRLIDSGKIKGTDKVSTILDPYLAAHGKPKLANFFGAAIGEATVLQLIRMGSGIRDFEDNFEFDQWCLAPSNSSKFWDYPYEAMKWSVSPENTKGGAPLYCNPGSGTAYSSTGYEVAGLVLAAIADSSSAWYDFDLGSAVFDDRSAYPSMSFPPKGNSTTKISQYLTVPGTSVASTWPTTTIFDQNPSILGFTCGSMVAAPRDVAKFFYHLLDDDAAHADAKPLLSDASRAEMINFQTLTIGWMARHLKYGAGLMDLSYGQYRGGTRVRVQGHEGDTYGFLSSQGYVPSLKGAYSVVSNVDTALPMDTMACYLLQTAVQVIGGNATESLGCKLPDMKGSMTQVFV